ncbi:hypothetical protein [Streptomyces botrytidirepellens]|uniref:Uncharacterized protein n=1 Tax=Streptomyces botrytidirepellens TaxID=2486417 RepID=A0A3M8X2C6_9ACTN|nr:hypothetical protein [Streptomyces botrytidirepellens]RNG35350.1 hypothetical protein EEJ42_04275 [Streptomyces botrytidirepellens]
MKQVAFFAVAAALIVWLIWNLWNLFRILTGLRNGSWQRPMWWTRLCSVSLFAGLASWIWGTFRTGLDVRDTCQFVHHERYDETYWDAHAKEFQKIFPLHNKCNAHYDLVPAWVNPAIVVCAVVSLAAIAVLLRFGTAYITNLPRRENQS